MEFKKVVAKDCEGKLGTYEVIYTQKSDDDGYLCSFINSIGDLEVQLVYINQLHID
jgi:hypothetical protein